MKCKLLKELEINESVASAETLASGVRRGGMLFAPIGTVIEDPQAFMLVLNMDAEAFDDECRLASLRTDGQIAAAAIGAKRLDAGIDPDDFAAFDSGEIIGYDGDGKFVPGPNWKEPVVDGEEDEDNIQEMETDGQ